MNKKTLCEEDVFSLEELSLVEAEVREQYMFPQIRDVAADEDGRIYIFDYKEARIKIFDRNEVYEYL